MIKDEYVIYFITQLLDGVRETSKAVREQLNPLLCWVLEASRHIEKKKMSHHTTFNKSLA